MPHRASEEASPPHRHHRAWGRDAALEVLERPERGESEDPVALWERVGLSAGATVVDVGAGTGYYAIPAARRVGPRGQVVAVDLSPELVAYLGERARAEQLPQLRAVQCSVDRIPLPDAMADWVLLSNVLHDLPDSTVREAARVLRPGGVLVNLDWAVRESPGGPPLEVRLTEEAAARRLRSVGLELEGSGPFGPYHYVQRWRSAPGSRPG